MSGCTVFVFLSLMEYALVNIVMGDIADIEKKKSAGLTNLLLGAKAPALGLPGGLKQPKSFQAVQDIVQEFNENKEQEVKERFTTIFLVRSFFHAIARLLTFIIVKIICRY